MFDVVSSGVDAPARAPLLRSPANPNGFDLRDLLGRVRDELAAVNAPLRKRYGSMDQPVFSLRQEALKHLTLADSILSHIESLQAMRAQEEAEAAALLRAAETAAGAARPAPIADVVVPFAARDQRLQPGDAYHPGSPWSAAA